MIFRRLVLLKSDYVVGLRCGLRLRTSYVLRIEILLLGMVSAGTEPEERNGEENDEDRGYASI